MQRTLVLALFWVMTTAAPPCVLAQDAVPVAVVTAVEGQASVLPGERPVRPFDWLPADARVATGPRSTVVLTFANGSRVRIRPRTRVLLQVGQVRTLAGGVDAMPVMPAFPVRVGGADPRRDAPAEAQAAHKAFLDAVGQTADPELLLLAAAVEFEWGRPVEAAGFVQRARAAKADPKLIQALERRMR
jgi:hypothetical protein